MSLPDNTILSLATPLTSQFSSAPEISFCGVILQKQRRVGGFLKGNFQTGLFFMEP